MLLNIEGITKYYQKKCVLDQIHCQLESGVYGLVGPNGVGKSTLLRILATVLDADSGRILIDNEDISNDEELYRSYIGYLPQKLGFYRHYSVVKFLQYMSTLKGLPKDEASIRISQLLLELNLTSYKHIKIKKLSEGVKQRIGIAQALLNDPKILILDEPTLNLDPKERINLRNIIGRLAGDRIILLSTHIISDIEYIAREIILLHDGHVAAMASPQELLKTMVGKVWEAVIPIDQLSAIQDKYQVTDIHHLNEDMKVRIISDKAPQIPCEQGEPLLDDLYMYYYRKENTTC